MGWSRTVVVPALLAIASCARRRDTARPLTAAVRPTTGPSGRSVFFHAVPEEAFWVSHTAELDRVVSSGSRLELAPSGELLSASWEIELARSGDILLGSLAVAEHLG